MTTASTLAARPARTIMPAAGLTRTTQTRVQTRDVRPTRGQYGLAEMAGMLEPVLLVMAASGVSLVIGSVIAGAFAR